MTDHCTMLLYLFQRIQKVSIKLPYFRCVLLSFFHLNLRLTYAYKQSIWKIKKISSKPKQFCSNTQSHKKFSNWGMDYIQRESTGSTHLPIRFARQILVVRSPCTIHEDLFNAPTFFQIAHLNSFFFKKIACVTR